MMRSRAAPAASSLYSTSWQPRLMMCANGSGGTSRTSGGAGACRAGELHASGLADTCPCNYPTQGAAFVVQVLHPYPHTRTPTPKPWQERAARERAEQALNSAHSPSAPENGAPSRAGSSRAASGGDAVAPADLETPGSVLMDGPSVLLSERALRPSDVQPISGGVAAHGRRDVAMEENGGGRMGGSAGGGSGGFALAVGLDGARDPDEKSQSMQILGKMMESGWQDDWAYLTKRLEVRWAGIRNQALDCRGLLVSTRRSLGDRDYYVGIGGKLNLYANLLNSYKVMMLQKTAFKEAFYTPDIFIGDFTDLLSSFNPETDTFPELFPNTYSLKSKITSIENNIAINQENISSIEIDIENLKEINGLIPPPISQTYNLSFVDIGGARQALCGRQGEEPVEDGAASSGARPARGEKAAAGAVSTDPRRGWRA